MIASPAMESLAQRYEGHRHALFGLCYRMTGSAADAEDLVQETFRRAIESPPPDEAAPLRPWLMRVATNLCIDALRRRKREAYFGPWLPSPVDTERLVRDLSPGPDARYDLAESATSAFLVALEALEPRPRAALVLADVLGLSGPEVAELIGTTPGNVRVLLHRARKTLERYDAERRVPTPELRERTARRLRELVMRMALRDWDGIARLLAEDVTSVHDAGGERIASVRVNTGIADVMRLYSSIVKLEPWPRGFEERDVNGLPALVVRFPHRERNYPEDAVFWIELDDDDRVRAIRTVVAPGKLTAIRFPGDRD
ncbi:MAG: sigma-70 family RNA polymerase sigma factor [Sandaracinaceae bacterium]|nr:sigma-70 family RNA polymerase sigma factor [Sandaracinaceae bacterium]